MKINRMKQTNKSHKFTFNEVMDFYEKLYPHGDFFRMDKLVLKTTPLTVSARLRETIDLSELFFKKEKNKR